MCSRSRASHNYGDLRLLSCAPHSQRFLFFGISVLLTNGRKVILLQDKCTQMSL